MKFTMKFLTNLEGIVIHKGELIKNIDAPSWIYWIILNLMIVGVSIQKVTYDLYQTEKSYNSQLSL